MKVAINRRNGFFVKRFGLMRTVLRMAKKDFANNLLSARFAIGFVLCLVLIPFSILINISNYRDRLAQYRIDRDAAEKAVQEVRVYSKLRPEVVISPQPLSVFSKGINDQVGSRVKIWLGDKPMLAAGKTEAGDNPFLASFFSIDFVDIAAIIFSLLALILSYDALSREKEEGTLKLQMSNSLGRSTCLAGKILGILMTLLPILAFSFLLGVVLILFSRSISFSAVEWGRIVLLFAVSLLYLAVFVFIGLLVSLRSRSSVTSLVLCLFLWVVFVFLIPNVAANFAESFVRVESRDNLDRVLADLDRELGEETSQAFKASGIPEGWSCWTCSSGADGFLETYGNPRPDFELFRRRAEISEPLRLQNADRRWALQQSYLASLARQARIAERLSLVSPAGVFRTIASAVCATDLGSHERTMGRTRQFRETFIRYLEAKNIFSSFAWITPAPPESFLPTEDALVVKRTGGEFKTAQAFWEWRKQQKDQWAAFQKLYQVKVPGDEPEDFPFLNVSDLPRFPDPPPDLLSGLEDSVLKAGLLLVEIILLFYLGYIAFLRFDVR
jgi:ABC-type transport system involved in multi-copper enzyme maturation permease subunit